MKWDDATLRVSRLDLWAASEGLKGRGGGEGGAGAGAAPAGAGLPPPTPRAAGSGGWSGSPGRSSAGAGTHRGRGGGGGRSDVVGEASGAAMAEFPSKVSTRTSSPAQGAGASVAALRPDLDFVRSVVGALMLLQLVRLPETPGHRIPPRAPPTPRLPRGALSTDAPRVPVAVPARTRTVRPGPQRPLTPHNPQGVPRGPPQTRAQTPPSPRTSPPRCWLTRHPAL